MFDPNIRLYDEIGNLLAVYRTIFCRQDNCDSGGSRIDVLKACNNCNIDWDAIFNLRKIYFPL